MIPPTWMSDFIAFAGTYDPDFAEQIEGATAEWIRKIGSTRIVARRSPGSEFA